MKLFNAKEMSDRLKNSPRNILGNRRLFFEELSSISVWDCRDRKVVRSLRSGRWFFQWLPLPPGTGWWGCSEAVRPAAKDIFYCTDISKANTEMWHHRVTCDMIILGLLWCNSEELYLCQIPSVPAAAVNNDISLASGTYFQIVLKHLPITWDIPELKQTQ